jgi:polycystin 1L2
MSIKIWHDNSGKTANDSSWYLKHVIIHDLQTRQKFYFICEKWLALDKDDCLIERVISLTSDDDKKQFNYLFAREAKMKLSDGHLWFSIFARPIQSSFSRLDRLTCCFVLLTISMLMNIMYFIQNKIL